MKEIVVAVGFPVPVRAYHDRTCLGTWVQCSDCAKWRLLKDIQDPSIIPEKWVCEDSSEDKYNSCRIAEENYDRTQSFIENVQFVPGSLVWCHKRHVWFDFPWPGIIDTGQASCEFISVTDSRRSVRMLPLLNIKLVYSNFLRYFVTYIPESENFEPISEWVNEKYLTKFTVKNSPVFSEKVSKESLQA